MPKGESKAISYYNNSYNLILLCVLMRTAINAAIIRDEKILLVKKKKVWILPGGKIEPCDNGSNINCLHREIEQKELPRVKLTNIWYYKNFYGKTPHKGEVLEAKVYFSEIQENERETAREILKSEWIGKRDISKYKISDITGKIIDSLKQDKYL